MEKSQIPPEDDRYASDPESSFDWLFSDPLLRRVVMFCQHYAIRGIWILVACILLHLGLGLGILYYMHRVTRSLHTLQGVVAASGYAS